MHAQRARAGVGEPAALQAGGAGDETVLVAFSGIAWAEQVEVGHAPAALPRSCPMPRIGRHDLSVAFDCCQAPTSAGVTTRP